MPFRSPPTHLAMALWLASVGAHSAAAAPLRLEFLPGTAEVALLLEVLGGEAGNLQAREVSSASPSTTLVLTRCFDR